MPQKQTRTTQHIVHGTRMQVHDVRRTVAESGALVAQSLLILERCRQLEANSGPERTNPRKPQPRKERLGPSASFLLSISGELEPTSIRRNSSRMARD